jgi:sterol desaturase/sphingolipid hydroxylase (fatty acid hydroxylase superfamily)
LGPSAKLQASRPAGLFCRPADQYHNADGVGPRTLDRSDPPRLNIMDLVPYAIPFFLLAIVLELVWDVRSGTHYYRTNDAINSLSLGVLSTTSKLVLIDIAGRVYAWVQEELTIVPWGLDGWLSLVVAFVLYDFCYYWFHRISHERRIFWAAHVAHHQSEEYNLSTALRQTSTGFLLSWLFYVPCFLLGMPAEAFVTVASANLIYQFWVHTRFVGTLGPLEKILVTPMNHRVHHARNPEYIDRNYGGFFILWDRLFGTYKAEDPQLPEDYGITRGLNSWNPVWANVHVYADMIRDSFRTPGLRNKLSIWYGRTDYVAPGVEKGPLRAGNRYDPPLEPGLKLYAFVQFVLLILVSLPILYSPDRLGPFGVPLLFGYLVVSLVILGWLLEARNRQWELLRLLLSLLVIVLLPLPVWLMSALAGLVVLTATVYLVLTREQGRLRLS